MRIIVPGTLTALLLSLVPSLSAQESSSARDREARALIEGMKSGERGPFSRIRWFCADGTVLPPDPYACAEHGGGVQHGELSSDARRLAELGYNIGTLLVSLSFEDFLDAEKNHDWLREIVVQKYLERVDDGWVYRRVRYYRGSRQIEDEEAAGAKLLIELLADAEWVRSHFLLAVELVRGIPHGRAPAQLDRIRLLATEIGDSLADFQATRSKIHSYPDSSDLAAVGDFLASRTDIDPDLRGKLEELTSALADYYRGDPRTELSPFRSVEPFRREPWRERLKELDESLARGGREEVVQLLAALSARLRGEIEASNDGVTNLRRLDLSLTLQEILVRHAAKSRVPAPFPETASSGAALDMTPGSSAASPHPSGAMTRQQALASARTLVIAAYGRGLLSARELQAQLREIELLTTAELASATAYRHTTSYLQRVSQWAQATVVYHFGSMTERYSRVESRTERFIDDLLRSTALLSLTKLVDALSQDANHMLGLTHTIFDRLEGGAIQGLNPGIARGVLEFVSASELAETEFKADHIYVLPRSLSKLPPVAGILTLSGGSSLSHLQLLARSLGIPNAVVPPSTVELLRPHLGKEILYVVSPLGAVILKDATGLSAKERRLLVEKEQTVGQRVRIDPKRLDLAERRVLTLDQLDPDRAQTIVGPKAAGVAKLRREFADRVAPGLVIPFGVFRAHLERRAEPDGPSLYDEMLAFYRRVSEMDREGRPAAESDRYIAERLRYFRSEIIELDLDPTLVASLKRGLARWGAEASFGVFVRSDTNVEDLPEFSGAGLNLTVPNQVRFADILRAIKRVWASPFTTRAYGWRRSVLETPEHTYVSVLIQRSVPVEKSGVLISADIETGRSDRVTVSAAEGIGGVVGGESAESLLIPFEGTPLLLAQAKAPEKQRLRTGEDGGIEVVPTSGSDRVLSDTEVAQLLRLTQELDERLEPLRDANGKAIPWDVEFGFLAGKLWLFQIRPLASDSRTAALAGLTALDRPARERRWRRVDLTQPLTTGS